MNVVYYRRWLDVLCEFACMYLEVCFSTQIGFRKNWKTGMGKIFQAMAEFVE